MIFTFCALIDPPLSPETELNCPTPLSLGLANPAMPVKGPGLFGIANI